MSLLTSFRSSDQTTVSVPSIVGNRSGGTSDEFRLIKWHFFAQAAAAASAGKNPRVIVITSARPGEGKSYVSHHLAANFALDPHTELTLIDANSENPSLGSSSWMGGGSGGPGLLDYLESHDMPESQIIKSTGIPNVNVILSGASRDHAPELLSNARFERLTAAITSRSNSFLIIDAAAVLADGSAAVLARSAGQIGYVVAANSTSRSDINSGLAAIDRIAGPIDEKTLGLIFN